MRESEMYRRAAKLYIGSVEDADDEDVEIIFRLLDDMKKAEKEEKMHENTL